jgi:hypothetical protein
MTLIALAWTLSIFEMAVEEGSGHPGFLLVDSPQKNLMPGAQSAVDDDTGLSQEIVRNHANIVSNVYQHIRSWSERYPFAQIVIVDNAPPAEEIFNRVVRYSGNPADPPYGLIDNEDRVSEESVSG